MRSKFLRLNRRDFINGLIVVIICTFITGLYQVVANEGVINWLTIKPVVIAVAGSALSYLTKMLLSNSSDDFMKAEPIKNSNSDGSQVL